MLHDDKLHIKHPFCLSCGHSGHFSVFKYSKEKEKKKTEIAHVNFNFLFCVLSTKLTRALLCLPGAAAVSGQVDGQRDKGRKRGCYYSGCYINLHQVIPLFTRSLAMGSRERGIKKKRKTATPTRARFVFSMPNGFWPCARQQQQQQQKQKQQHYPIHAIYPEPQPKMESRSSPVEYLLAALLLLLLFFFCILDFLICLFVFSAFFVLGRLLL